MLVVVLGVIGTSTWALVEGIRSTDGKVNDFWTILSNLQDDVSYLHQIESLLEPPAPHMSRLHSMNGCLHNGKPHYKSLSPPYPHVYTSGQTSIQSLLHYRL